MCKWLLREIKRNRDNECPVSRIMGHRNYGENEATKTIRRNAPEPREARRHPNENRSSPRE